MPSRHDRPVDEEWIASAHRRLPCLPRRRSGRRPRSRPSATRRFVSGVARHAAGRGVAARHRPLPGVRPVPAPRRLAARGGPRRRSDVDDVGDDGRPRRDAARRGDSGRAAAPGQPGRRPRQPRGPRRAHAAGPRDRGDGLRGGRLAGGGAPGRRSPRDRGGSRGRGAATCLRATPTSSSTCTGWPTCPISTPASPRWRGCWHPPARRSSSSTTPGPRSARSSSTRSGTATSAT